MKKVKTLIIAVVVFGLAYVAYTLSINEGNTKLSSEALSDFAVDDTASIDKLIITDTEGNDGVTLIRAEEFWTMEGGDCIQQHLVNTILETIKYIKVKSPVPEGEVETANKNLTVHHKKVEIYVKGEITKTWYIGNATQDQYGTYMLLKDPEKGKSPEPFIMYQPNMYGNLKTRFITNPLEFQCTGVFNYDPINIASVDVKLEEDKSKNYKIVANDENSFSLYNNGEEVSDFDTTRVRGYLLFYKKIHFERQNYLITESQVDSVRQTTPYYTIKVTTKTGEENLVKCFRKGMMREQYDFEGNLIEWDRDRLWLVLDDGQFVVAQYHVFDKLLKEVDFFKNVPPPVQ